MEDPYGLTSYNNYPHSVMNEHAKSTESSVGFSKNNAKICNAIIS
jgi:hypothetical protein